MSADERRVKEIRQKWVGFPHTPADHGTAGPEIKILLTHIDALTARLAEAHAALGNVIGLAAYLDECDYWFGEQIEPTAKERIAKARALLTPPPTPGKEER